MASSNGRPLRLLCLDGGGVKGLTSLLILERLFRTIQTESGSSELPKPHDYFDLIGGTSTGGLIAIMLGRLHMSIAECIAAYKNISELVFAGSWRQAWGVKYLIPAFGGAWYRGEDLERAVKHLLVQRGMDENVMLKEDLTDCKVFVCATCPQNSQPDLLRSYLTSDPSQENYDCHLWEAVRATSAAPTIFEKITLKASGTDFVDGAFYLNNPIYELMREAKRVYPGSNVGCVLSLGTGWPNPTSLEDPSLPNLVQACAKIAVDAQRKAEEFLHDDTGKELWKAQKYFRFNVEQGVQGVKLDEWKELKTLEANTKAYLARSDKAEELRKCAKNLINPTPLAARRRHMSTIPRDPNPNFTGRLEHLGSIDRIFQSSDPLHQRVVLWGLGGVGKSQIALRYAEQQQTHLDVFWVRADCKDNLVIDYGRIAQKLKPTLPYPGNPLEILSTVRDHLEDGDSNPWLMILDSADDVGIFVEPQDGQPALVVFMPRTSQGRILVTSRDSRMAGLIDGQVVPALNGIQVASMSENEGANLLKQSIPRDLFDESEASNFEQCKQLAVMLGGLPLALSQAAAFIRNERVSLEEFSALHRSAKDHSELYRYPAYSQDKERQSVLLTWEVSYERLGGHSSIESKSPSARLLDLMGYIDSQAIPKRLLEGIYSKHLYQANTPFLTAIGRLLNLCLVHWDRQSEVYSIHPVVHEWIHRRLGPDEHRINANLILSEADRLFFDIKTDSSTRTACNALLRHITAAIDFAVKYPDPDVGLSDISRNIAFAAHKVDIYDAAAHLLEASISASENLGPPEKLGSRRLALAWCLWCSGNSVRALTKAKSCLAIVGESQLEVVKGIMRFCLLSEARFSDAIAVQEDLLAIKVSKYGEVSEEVAECKFDLARTINKMQMEYQDDKDFPETINPTQAARLYDEAMMILENLGKTSLNMYLLSKSSRNCLEEDQDIKASTLVHLVKVSTEKDGHQDMNTLELIIHYLVHLMRLGRYLEAEMLAKQVLVHEPGWAQGILVVVWTKIIYLLGTSLFLQRDFAQSDLHFHEVIRRSHSKQTYSSWIDEALDGSVFHLVASLNAQHREDDAIEIRQKFPGSVERAERRYGTTAALLLERIATHNKPTEDTSAPKESRGRKRSRTRSF